MTHSLVRWIVLLFGLYAITKSYRGFKKQQGYTANHKRANMLFVSSIHLQALLGIVLYFQKGWHSNIGNAFADMGNSFLRFWSIEHMFGMILAVVLIQMGSSKSKKQATDHAKHKTAFTYFALGMFVILVTIPWPFREAIGRALWPF
ncbi:MAG: hypothetical protein JXR19_07320 [Bacteroidia bacterium]